MLAAMRITRPRRSLLAAGVAALLLPGMAGLASLAGCAARADPPRQHPGSGRAAARPTEKGLGALRAGLTGRADRPAYYLSLGDSLARGIQPDAGGQDVATGQGYPDQLAALLRGQLGGLRLIKLGCPGETTSTMIHGGICRYPAGSQLAQAARFLRSYHGPVALITIDIGGNDPNSCVLGRPLVTILPCMNRRMPQTERNLSAILARLRSAAGPRVLIVGMTYYVPELGLWDRGQTGREIAGVTADFVAGADKMLVARYHRYGARVADVFGAFRSSDFASTRPATEPAGSPAGGRPGTGRGAGPVNVGIVCSLTWMCAAPPRGPNEHANDVGYRVIARAFWRAITR